MLFSSTFSADASTNPSIRFRPGFTWRFIFLWPDSHSRQFYIHFSQSQSLRFLRWPLQNYISLKQFCDQQIQPEGVITVHASEQTISQQRTKRALTVERNNTAELLDKLLYVFLRFLSPRLWGLEEVGMKQACQNMVSPMAMALCCQEEKCIDHILSNLFFW